MKIATSFVLFISILLGLTDISWAARVHGVLRVVKGKVQVTSGKSGLVKRARLGQKVYPKDTIKTGKASRVKIVMIDNNEIMISPESEVTLQKYEYNPEDNKKEVLLNVIYGKVRSKVKQKYKGKKSSSYKVKTPSAVAGVRGTDFFTSYDHLKDTTRVITFSGQVAVGLPGANGSIVNSVVVNAGQFTTNNPKIAPSEPKILPKKELERFDRATLLDHSDFKEMDPRNIQPHQDDRRPQSEGGGDSARLDPNIPFEPPTPGCFGGECVQEPKIPPRLTDVPKCFHCLHNRDNINETIQHGTTKILVNICQTGVDCP